MEQRQLAETVRRILQAARLDGWQVSSLAALRIPIKTSAHPTGIRHVQWLIHILCKSGARVEQQATHFGQSGVFCTEWLLACS